MPNPGYKLEDARNEIARVLGITLPCDIGQKRVLKCDVNGEPCTIIFFPIVTRSATADYGEQRYIDINSCGDTPWKEIKEAWEDSINSGRKFFFFAVQHVDNVLKGYIYSLEGSIAEREKKSVYFSEECIQDLTTNNIGAIKRYYLSKTGVVSVVPYAEIGNYIKFFDNRIFSVKRLQISCIVSLLPTGKQFANSNRNRIIFGAPGTGKSHFLELEKDNLLGVKKDSNGKVTDKGIGDFERVTFHPDYSYAQFVGCYKPTMNDEKIEYSFVPGPFTRILVKALQNIKDANGDKAKVKPYLLIIEELNRAKTAAVFGDVFQLLDRGADGVSEYEIHPSEDLRKYLAQELGVSEDAVASIKIPDNMFIWATMNSADQGVFPLDTAFKRRWNFEYVDINNNEDGCDFDIKFNNKNESVKWNELRKAINNVLSNEPVKAHEDKLLGPYFIKDQKDDDRNTNMFCDKVLMYLFDDVGRTRRKDIFEDGFEYDATKHKKINLNRLSTIREGFEAVGPEIFVKAILSEL